MSDSITCAWQSGAISVILYIAMTKFLGDKLCNEKNETRKYFVLFMIVFLSVYLRYNFFD